MNNVIAQVQQKQLPPQKAALGILNLVINQIIMHGPPCDCPKEESYKLFCKI
jgi:hypothetical protein